MSGHATPLTARAGTALDLERLTYATIVLMSVLVVYDGWAELTSFLGVAVVIIGPLIALTVAHFFAGVLQAYAEQHRPLTARELRHLAAEQPQALLAAVPPLVVLLIGWISPLDARNTITVLLWVGAFTLVALTALAARHAGLRGWRWLLVSLSGGLVGLIVISLQVLLKPH